jgi:hypothetical protein
MDFSDFITLILFFVFIFGPLLKRNKKKTVSTSGKSKPSGFSVMGKLNDVLKEAAREMQAQAEQARKKEASGGANVSRGFNESPFGQTEENAADQTFWDEIDDRDDPDFYSEDLNAQVHEPVGPVTEQPPVVSIQEAPRKVAQRRNAKVSKHFDRTGVQTRHSRGGPRRLPARARGLQKAIIWSEILGKPVGLKDSNSFSRY